MSEPCVIIIYIFLSVALMCNICAQAQNLLCGGLGVICQIHKCMFLFMNFFPFPTLNDIQLSSEIDK